VLGKLLTDQQFFDFGWRIPFIASALLVFVGLYVRLKITETPEFLKVIENNERIKIPVAEVLFKHTKILVLGTLVAVTTFLLFYLMTVFALSWGTTALHYERSGFLSAQMIAMLFFAAAIPLSAVIADRYGRGNMLIIASMLIIAFGLCFSFLFTTGSWVLVVAFLSIGLFLMGLTYGPMGTALAEIFPPSVRYTGASLAFTLAGILGASLAPYLGTQLAKTYGISYVGYYLSISATLTLVALVFARPSMQDKVK
jgi:MFS family permease